MSVVRWRIAANMVFMTPNTPPKAIMPATKWVRSRHFWFASLILAKYAAFRHGRDRDFLEAAQQPLGHCLARAGPSVRSTMEV